ncbi:MAG: PmoA family protein, partial [Thermoguttaceae bacterium]|nr:PmoA family protein [Thermoguttaceae bacterium]
MNFSKIVVGALLVCALFALEASAQSEETSSGFSWKEDERAVSLYDGSQLVLKFNYAFLDHKDLNVPENEPRRFAGDYIYPLYGVLGENLLDDAPKDHYHHHGVFWTWPGVFVHQEDGTTKQYDLWTSNTPIRQRFLKLNSLEVQGSVAVVSVENGWFIGPASTIPDEELNPLKKGFNIAENADLYGERIMDERATFFVHPVEIVENIKSRAIDFILELTPTTKDVSLQGAEKKSYGGLTIRFRPQGKIGVDEFITTDEGVAKDDMP